MNERTPRLSESKDFQDPRYNLDKNFKPIFLKQQPFLHQSTETQETLKSSYVAYNRQISNSVTKLATKETKDSPETINERLNHLASLTIKETAKSLGYDPTEKIEIAKVDILTIDATLGMLSSFIEKSTNDGQNIHQIEASINEFLNENLNQKERTENIDAKISKQSEMTEEDFKSPLNQLFLSTLNDNNLRNLTTQLLDNPDQNKDKVLHIAHSLPTSNLTLVSTQILDTIKKDPNNKTLKVLFKDISSQSSHGEKAIQQEFTKSMAEISPKLDFGRGMNSLTQNRLFLGLTYIWSTIVFLGNSINAVSLSIGDNRSKNKAAILKSLALAGAAGSVMGVTGASILTGKPPLKVAEDFLTKAYNYLSLTKDDVDAMTVEETKVTVPRLLEQSGPYTAAIFTDGDIIQSITSTKTVIEGNADLTKNVATKKLNLLHQEIQKRAPEKAKFFYENFLKPSQKNPKQSLLLVYFIQKSYQRSEVTTAGSFFSKLKQDPDNYPSIEDFKALENE